jgi:phage gpG-like protein
MALTIKLSSTSLNAISADFAKIESRSRNAANNLKRDVALIFQSETDEVFASAPRGSSGGSVYGGSGVVWSKLSDAYLARRPDRASGQILRDTGTLLNSLQVGGGGNILESDGNSIRFGTSLIKAGRLNRDRPFLFITQAMAAAIAKLYERYLLDDR